MAEAVGTRTSVGCVLGCGVLGSGVLTGEVEADSLGAGALTVEGLGSTSGVSTSLPVSTGIKRVKYSLLPSL